MGWLQEREIFICLSTRLRQISAAAGAQWQVRSGRWAGGGAQRVSNDREQQQLWHIIDNDKAAGRQQAYVHNNF